MKTVMGVLGCLILLLTAMTAAATTTLIPMSADETHLELLAQDDSALHFRLQLGPLSAEKVATPAGDFTRLLIPGGHSSQEEGAPLLPMINRLIELPLGAEFSVEILGTSAREIDLGALGFADPLIPAQPSMPKNVELADWPFIYERGAYRAEPVARELVNLVEVGQLRGMRLGRVELSPVSYYSSSKTLRVEESIEFRLNFTGGDRFAEAELKALTRSPFFNHFADGITGSRGLHDDYPDHVRDLVTMVIVTPPEFEFQLADFVDWKTRRGFKTILAVTGTPEVGTTKEQIRDYLHGLYDDATPEQPAPSFVLFVGDTGQMPAWTESGYTTDRPYCAVDGDWIPDMYYGRFSATNPTQLQAMLDKTLMYDQFAMPDPSYLEEVVMIAGVDGSYATTHGNGQINYGTEHYFNAEHDIFSHTYLYPLSGSSGSAIIQNVSDGVSYVNYTAHGGVTYWVDPQFNQSDVNGLQNYGKYCLAVGNCCVTGSFGSPECFGETWLRAEGKGGIGYIGASMNTLWNEDYWWGVGYHPASQINGSAYPYESTGLGVYDGVFHDHGEAMTQWYVTNDAIIFSGNLAVQEAGSGYANNYWTTYNLQGDPSISTWIGTPGTNPVSHPASLFTTSNSMLIDALPGSYCALSKDGVLIGAGTVDESGSLDMELWEIMTPGPAELIVMAQFMEPYSILLNVIVPATITFDPSSIDAGVPTVVTVGVFESDGTTPKPGIDIWAEGVGYSTGASTTGADGYCQLSLDYPYGPSLDICGQDPAETWLLFREPLTVNADPLTNVAMRVSTDIGLSGAFALNLPGTLEAFRPFGGALPVHELWCYVNDGAGAMTTLDDMTLTPTELGEVHGVFAVIGHDVVSASFPIIEAFGTLSGHVDAAGEAASGAVVVGWNDAMEMAFEATCNASGDYAVSGDILVADYTVTVNYFGYLPYSEPLFVNYGANVHDIALMAAPSGVITGTVTELGSGAPLAATVKVFRSDTGVLYDEVVCDPGSGIYTTGSLPYFDWTLTVRDVGHIPETVAVTVDAASVSQDFVLEETVGNILIINDGAKSSYHAAKYDDRGNLLEAAYTAEPKTINTIVNDLEGLGYTVLVESMTSDPASWDFYDFLMTCSGANTTTLSNSTFRSALITFVQNGGKLLVEGGEVGYDFYSDNPFASTVLRINDWDGDSSGSVTVYDAAHPVMSFPNAITGPITVSYDGYGDQDALDAIAGAERIGSWSGASSNASVIVQDLDATPEDGDFVFFAWCYESMDAAKRVQLLENAVVWLIGGGLTPVEDLPEVLPTALALRGNYPNPFNPKTDIRFDLPSAGKTELAVYDVKGRRVVTLLDGDMPAGSHTVSWDGRDAEGGPVSSGVYFARVLSGGDAVSRKMLLLK
jgi:hypothetical protein